MSTADTRTSDVESSAKAIVEDVKRHVEPVKVASIPEIYSIIEIYAEKALTSFREKIVAEERVKLLKKMRDSFSRKATRETEPWASLEEVEKTHIWSDGYDAAQLQGCMLIDHIIKKDEEALTPPKETNK